MTHMEALQKATHELAEHRVCMTSNAYRIALDARRAELTGTLVKPQPYSLNLPIVATTIKSL